MHENLDRSEPAKTPQTPPKPGDGHIVFGRTSVLGQEALREILHNRALRWERADGDQGRTDRLRLGAEQSDPVELEVHQSPEGGVHIKVRRGAAVAYIALGDMKGERNQVQLAVTNTDPAQEPCYGWRHRIIVNDRGEGVEPHIGGPESLEALQQPIWDGRNFYDRVPRTELPGGG